MVLTFKHTEIIKGDKLIVKSVLPLIVWDTPLAYGENTIMCLFECCSYFLVLRYCRVLTWEDAYYDNLDQLDPLANHCFHDTIESLHSGCYSHDTLGLSVAKMSYHVYSLGEGYGSIH